MRRTFLLILVALLPMIASAYDAKINGIYYNFNGNEAEVTSASGYYYSGNVVIPASVTYNGKTYSVTSIGEYAFSHCSSLNTVTIPNSVTSIGFRAFLCCTNLASVTIPNSVTTIGGQAFNCCPALTSVIIPNSVTSIGDAAFHDCSGLASVTIPESVTSIGASVFHNCSSLTSVTIPNSVTSISNLVFCNCSALTSVTIGNSVTSIGNQAFEECSSLTSITIPKSVTSMGESVFRGCNNLTNIVVAQGNSIYDSRDNCNAIIETNSNTLVVGCKNTIIPNSVKIIRGQAFYGCKGLTHVTIPNSVNTIGYIAFANCTDLAQITIGSGVSYLDKYAFSSCKSLTSVTLDNNAIVSETRTSSTSLKSIFGSQVQNYQLGETVKNIGDYAFYGSENLRAISIPESVTRIGEYAFAGCKLRNVLIKCTIPPSGGSAFSNQTYYHTTLYIPTGSWDAYAYDDNWYLFHNIRETATEEEQLSMQQAYTLMDAGTFAYSIYDPVNDCIGTINSVSGIDENNPNHSWQVIEADGEQYLYNVGAKKFVVSLSDGRFMLSSSPSSIEIENGSNGIIIGTQKSRQWALVSNERLSAEQAIITGVSPLGETEEGTAYDLSGSQIINGKLPRGINIIRHSDGTTRKVLMK